MAFIRFLLCEKMYKSIIIQNKGENIIPRIYVVNSILFYCTEYEKERFLFSLQIYEYLFSLLLLALVYFGVIGLWMVVASSVEAIRN